MGQEQAETQDGIRAGYQAAVQMAIYDGQLSWQITGIFVQFAILMIAGAVFPSFIGTKEPLMVAIAGSIVSLAGIVMTAMFGSMVMRTRTYEEYWVLRAAHLESCLRGDIQTLSGSDALSRNSRVTVRGQTVHMRATSAVRTKQMLGTFYVLFLATFFILLCINLLRLCGSVQS